MSFHVTLLLSLSLLAGCASAGEPEEIVDGSNEIRFGYSVDGGFVDSSYPFTNPYGHKFFAIDGKCHYYTSRDKTEGIVEGELTADEAERLTRELGYARLPAWNGSLGPSCLDASSVRLMSSSERLTCTCGCEGAPDGAAQAVDTADTWLDTMADQGSPLTGAIRVVAQPSSASASYTRNAWPLATPIEMVEGLVAQQSFGLSAASGARFEGTDAQALRALRSDWLAAAKEARERGRPVIGLLVNDSSATDDGAMTDYLLLIKDELATDTAAALASFFGRTL